MSVHEQDPQSESRVTAPVTDAAPPAAGGVVPEPGGVVPEPGGVVPVAGQAEPGEPALSGQAAVPPFGEQVATQIGGWRGMVESAIPITVFVVVNLIFSLQPALVASVVLAVLLAVVRLGQGKPVRYAMNGLFGIGLGAVIAWRSGEARDFYLPGILLSYGYAAGMIVSVVVRHPVVGWLWSVLFAKGTGEWRGDRRLLRTFTWLTLLWAFVWIVKVSVQAWLWAADEEHLLGVARLALGTPPYLLLLAITVWVVHRVQRSAEAVRPA